MLAVSKGLKVPHTEGTPSPASLSQLLPHNPHSGFPTFPEAGCDPTPRSQGSLKIPIRSARAHLISHHTQGKTASPPVSPDLTTPMLTGVLPPAAPGYSPCCAPCPEPHWPPLTYPLQQPHPHPGSRPASPALQPRCTRPPQDFTVSIRLSPRDSELSGGQRSWSWHCFPQGQRPALTGHHSLPPSNNPKRWVVTPFDRGGPVPKKAWPATSRGGI